MAHNAATQGTTSSFANLHILTHPPIFTGPFDTSAEVGGTFLFCVYVTSGALPMYFQWQSGSTILTDDTRITGSTGSCLTINNIQVTDTGSYRCFVNNFYGSVTSSWANGHVNLHAPLVVTNPIDQTNYKTFTASFSVSASGTFPLTYQWYSGSTPLVDTTRLTGSQLVNGTASKLQLNNLQLNDAGPYRVSVSNLVGTVYSTYANLTVLDNIIIVTTSDSMSAAVAPLNQSVGLRFGSTQVSPPYVEPTVPSFGVSLGSGYIFTQVIGIYGGNETASVNLGFDGGYIFNTVVPIYGGNETASLAVGFDSGYIFDVLKILPYVPNETASVSVGFEGGYTRSIVTPILEIEDTVASFGVSLLSGFTGSM